MKTVLGAASVRNLFALFALSPAFFGCNELLDLLAHENQTNTSPNEPGIGGDIGTGSDSESPDSSDAASGGFGGVGIGGGHGGEATTGSGGHGGSELGGTGPTGSGSGAASTGTTSAIVCDSGYEPQGDACVDIDECVTISVTCNIHAHCENHPGAFHCACDDGYQDKGNGCEQMGWTKVAGDLEGESFCGIRQDGALYCWGLDLGFGSGSGTSTLTRVSTSTPTRVNGSWKSISLGGSGRCGVQVDGTLWCAGYVGSALGGSTTPLVPGDASLSESWLQVGVDADWDHTEVGVPQACAFKMDGSLWCWGLGAIGDGINVDSSYPVKVLDDPLDPYVDVANSVSSVYCNGSGIIAAAPRTCAVRKSGSLWCWGSVDDSGEFIDKYACHHSLSPKLIITGTGFTNVFPSFSETLASKNDGLWKAGSQWAWNKVDSSSSVSFFANNSFQYCSVATAGALLCVGASDYTQWDPATDGTQTQIAGTWDAVSVGRSAACGVTQNGELLCWGHNQEGQLGLGTNLDWSVLHQVGLDTDWAEVIDLGAEEEVMVARKIDGSVWTWGLAGHDYSDLASYNVPQSSACGPLSKLTAWGGISDKDELVSCIWPIGGQQTERVVNVAGPVQSSALNRAPDCVLTPSGEIYCATTKCSSGSMQYIWQEPAPGDKFISISAGSYSFEETACAIKVDGTLWCGRPSDECATQSALPACNSLSSAAANAPGTLTQIGSETDWIKVSGDADWRCGIRAPGSLWCWGGDQRRYSLGQCFDVPELVSPDSDWVDVVAAYANTCARRQDGRVTCWTTSGSFDLPGSGWTSVAHRFGQGLCAVRDDGTLWCQGLSIPTNAAYFGLTARGTEWTTTPLPVLRPW